MFRFNRLLYGAFMICLCGLMTMSEVAGGTNQTDIFIAKAAERFGESGRMAASFIVDNMPAADREQLDSDFLWVNLSLAFAARENFPWAKSVPQDLFFNEILPYAALDEPRDPWREEFFKIGSDIVQGCTNATQAAQALNREIFKRIGVHYNTARKRNNQSPAESIAQGKATCTGLSIILVDACRAVGIPARVAGVPQWVHKEGNHTWVEIWDGEWHFTGADEYKRAGLDLAWFKHDAAVTARSSNPLNQVYAASWRRTGDYFPLSWNLASRDVPAVNVSAGYAALESDPKPAGRTVHLRLRETAGGGRIAADVEMRSAAGHLLARGRTRAGTADLNDMPDFRLPNGATNVIFRALHGNEFREKLVSCPPGPDATVDLDWSEMSPVSAAILAAEEWLSQPAAERGAPPDTEISKEDAVRLVNLAWEEVKNCRAASAASEIAAREIVLGAKILKWMEKDFGETKNGQRSLWITLHGGGKATPEENDKNWRGYFGRYTFPPGSINIAPRAPANTWNMWHVPGVDGLFDRLIADYVIQRGVDPNRVYLIGYSAGGDGVYQLAPRMADRFAAAAMCAGHPNDATPEGLRNLPFFLYMGGDDAAYKRNTVVREFCAKIDLLQNNDPAGYAHWLTIYPGLGHGMQGREAEMIPRMSPLARVSWPKRVVWKQDDVTHTRFYWLARPADAVKPREIYAARVDGQTITIETPASGELTLRLADALLDLDQPIKVVAAGRTVFEDTVARSFSAIERSLSEHEDPETAATATLNVSW